MITALTLSIFICIYLYSKHRQSLERIKILMVEFDKLSTTEGEARMSLTSQAIKNCSDSTQIDFYSPNSRCVLNKVIFKEQNYLINRILQINRE